MWTVVLLVWCERQLLVIFRATADTACDDPGGVLNIVIPAKAGIQAGAPYWIPASAEMTYDRL